MHERPSVNHPNAQHQTVIPQASQESLYRAPQGESFNFGTPGNYPCHLSLRVATRDQAERKLEAGKRAETGLFVCHMRSFQPRRTIRQSR